MRKLFFDFYKKRYSNPTEMEEKFHNAIKDLIESGDIKHKKYDEFCDQNGLEKIIKKKVILADPCGHGSSSRSSC